MVRKWSVLIAVVMTLALLLACGPAAPVEPSLPADLHLEPETPSGAHLTPNPVEESMPIYGGTLITGYYIPRSFDGHQYAGYGPCAQLPVFNQLVMFDINYKECVPETIIGDLAESWEWSEDGKSITFKLRQGVKWHDGVPFTANDVIYSLDKMNDVNRSAISNRFPAYESTEKIDDYTVKVHLEYPSASFMTALAQGESQIQALHLAGTDHQIAEFMVGTGPFILEDFLTQVHIKYQRNPDYWKKDQYGNQLPYLDGMIYYHTLFIKGMDLLIARRLDLLGGMTGASRLDRYDKMSQGAPELLWQRRERYSGMQVFLNLNKEPLDDIRVRRAIGLVLDQKDMIIASRGDLRFGKLDTGLLHPSLGLPGEEVIKLMGWDKPYQERVAEAQQLMAEAGYPDGFELNMLTGESGDVSMTFADLLRKNLKIDADVNCNLGGIEVQKRIAENNYHTYVHFLELMDPVGLDVYFGSEGHANYSNYSNSELDKMLGELDHIIDPDERREAVWAIERLLLTDLVALPTGCFTPIFQPYYPHLKNLRWNNISYSNINRFEDVWIDESLRVK
jgi:peptide/nickel transport system substrate-binding protein